MLGRRVLLVADVFDDIADDRRIAAPNRFSTTLTG